jgi:hypothetical protein
MTPRRNTNTAGHVATRGIFDILLRRRSAIEDGDRVDLDDALARFQECRHTMDFAQLREAAIDGAVALSELVDLIPPPDDQDEDLEP